jgi:ABC-type multidrug transport system ATPase subunit
MNCQISIGYKDKLLYKDVKIELPTHGILSFIGDNGSGKSTIYKTFLGIIPPLSGEISSEIKEQTSVVSDYIQMPEEVKVQDILGLLGEEKVSYGEQNYKAIFTSVMKTKKQFVKTLSSGQRRIVEIFSALASGKKIILLDEASNSLDYKNKSLFLHEVKKLSEQDILFLHTSHDMEDISFLKGAVYGLFKEEKRIKQYKGKDYSPNQLRTFLGYGEGGLQHEYIV